MLNRAFPVLACALLCGAQAVSAQMMGGTKPGQVIVDELRKGGYVLYMRHAHADVGDDVVADAAFLQDCGKQRRLSAQGRSAAQKAGADMRALGIPVSQIYSGELCRARETAELLGLGPVQPLAELNDPAAWRVRGKDVSGFVGANRTLLATPPRAGGNTLLVSHMQKGATAISPMLDLLEPGTVAVFRPAAGNPELVAVIRAADWPYLGVGELPLR